MANIYQEITDIVGKTPLLKLQRYMDANACKADILAKLEYQNPGGSVKDRVAIRMIDEAEKAGILHKGDVIIEPTSGNTGIGLACVAAARGLSSDHHDAGNHERGTKKTVICIWGRACPDTGIQGCERFDPQGK